MPVDRPAYMHSFAMTERYLVLAEFPLVVDPLRLLLMVAPFIRNYRWTPDRGLRFHVFEKDGGRLVTSAVADPAFAFHHVNAYEEGDTVVLDMIAYPDAGIIDQLYLARLRAGDPVDATGTLTRYIIPLDGSQEVAVTDSQTRCSSCRASTTASAPDAPTAGCGGPAGAPARPSSTASS